MIIVAEGISAAGKTNWCRRFEPEMVVPENGRLTAPRDLAAAARFWSERNADRWGAALAAEARAGIAVCDTDPLKLHYAWCLWRIGEASAKEWRLQLAAERESVAARRIGFADRYFIAEIDPALARARRDADLTRTRRNFELHLRLQPPLLDWYRALAIALPGVVRFGLPSGPAAALGGRAHPELRYDLATFDRFIALLPAR